MSVRHFSDEQCKDFGELVQAGFDPSAVSRRTLYKDLLEPQRGGNRCYQIWEKSSFDKLLSLGFDVDAKDFIIVDEETVPELRFLIP